MGQLYTNNVEAPIATAILDGDTVLTIAYPEFGYMPVLDTESDDYFMLTIHKAVFPEEEWEVIKVTSMDIPNRQITVVRGQEGTQSQSWGIDAVVSMRLTGDSISRLRTETTLDTVLVGDTGDILVDVGGGVLSAPLLTNIVPPPSFTNISVVNSPTVYSQSAGERYAWWRLTYDINNLPQDFSVEIRHSGNSGNDNIQYSLYNNTGTLLGRSEQLTTAASTSGIIVTNGVRMNSANYYIRLENLDSVVLNVAMEWGYNNT